MIEGVHYFYSDCYRIDNPYRMIARVASDYDLALLAASALHVSTESVWGFVRENLFIQDAQSLEHFWMTYIYS